MVFITGDCHAEFIKFTSRNFPEGKTLTEDDIVIICGDFGLWNNTPEERYKLDWLNGKPWTTVFVDGNHENFDRLYSDEFPIVDFHGGKAHKIRTKIYHIIRGSVCEFKGKKFFMFGGAASHDIEDGILSVEDYPSIRDMMKDYQNRTISGQGLRIEHFSWWKEELPSGKEMQHGREELAKVGNKVDFVISHTAPATINRLLGYNRVDTAEKYFDELINEGLQYKEWWSGHIHQNTYGVLGKHNIVYYDIKRVL